MVLLSLALTGCGSVAPPLRGPGSAGVAARSEAVDPYPVDAGRHWVYQTWQTQGEQPEKPGKEQRLTIDRAVPEGMVMRRFYGDWEAPATLVRKTAAAIVLSRFQADGPQATDSITVLRLPITPGDAWAGRTLVGATERIVVMGVEDVTVPAGRFGAWHVQHRLQYDGGGGDTLDYWYAGGVGMDQAIERITLSAGGQPLKMQVRALLADYSR